MGDHDALRCESCLAPVYTPGEAYAITGVHPPQEWAGGFSFLDMCALRRWQGVVYRDVYPILEIASAKGTVEVSPHWCWGHPNVGGVSCWVIASLIDAGHSVPDVARDFGIGVEDVEAACEFQRAVTSWRPRRALR